MKRRRANPEAEHALQLGAAFIRQGAALVAIDPGASTGWCVARSLATNNATGTDVMMASGQDRTADAARAVLAVLGDVPIGLLVIEKPFGGMGGRIARVSLPWSAGEVRGRLAAQQVDEEALWLPLPGQWRAALGIAGGYRQRTEINASVHELAEETCGAMRKPGGGPEYDRANAVCLALAARRLCATFAAGQQPGSST